MAFQLTVEEARVAPDVAKGMYLLLKSLFMFIALLIFVFFFVLGSFLVNNIFALILFYSGATRSCVSLALRRGLMELGESWIIH